MITFVISKEFISLVIDNVPYNVNKNNSNFEEIKKKLKEEDYVDLLDLINESNSIKKKFIEEEISDLTITGSSIFYKGKPVDNSIVNQIIETKRQGYKFDNLLKFLENLLENTSFSVVTELYDWISSSKNISITEDGAFLAYKKVKENYFDIYSGSMDNSVGKIVEMERNEVDDNRRNECSKGLHFCSYDYLNYYGSMTDTNKVIIVKVFPQDVVSIPVDYNFQKGRCYRYEVVGEIEKWRDGETLTKTVDDYEETECPSLYADDIDNHSEFSVFNKADEEDMDDVVDIFVFEDIIATLNTPKMTKIYNVYYGKEVKHLRTKTIAISYMKVIYDKDYDDFIRLVNKEV